MRTIAIVNQKGGCGKTTTTINLAAICAARGLRTLVVDMDPQSHCAAGLGVPDEALENSIGKALLRDVNGGVSRASLIWEVSRNLDLAPSTMSLAGLEAPGGGLHELEDRDLRLARLLAHLAPHYDRCFIDCPPTIGLLTYNALRAAGEAIIPVQTEYFAFCGAKKQWETIQNLVESVHHPIACYVLPSLHNEQEKIERDILESIRKEFKGKVIPIVIHDRAEVREAATFGQPIGEYAPQSVTVKDFERLADWLEDHPADPPEIQVEVKRSMMAPFACQPRDAAVPAGAMTSGEHRSPLGPSNASSTIVGNAVPTSSPHSPHVPSRAPDVSGTNSRAAEMARRVRALTERRRTEVAAVTTTPESGREGATASASGSSTPTAAKVHPLVLYRDPPHPPPASTHTVLTAAQAAELAQQRRETIVEQKDLPASVQQLPANIVRLFGVRQTKQGVLFLQPGPPGMRIQVAGEFNQWSATATALRYNPDTAVHELLLPLEPGEYQYRLVIDGQWQADPYNANRRRNDFGQDNNIVTVT